MRHALKYLGEKGTVAADIPISFSVPFVIECPKCRNPYNVRLKDVHQVEVSSASPSDFRDKI
jgi:hypothetical protein